VMDMDVDDHRIFPVFDLSCAGLTS
jgi:hypothetical protein